MHVLDRYGNGGNFSGSSIIIPAQFNFYLPKSNVRVNPGTITDVQVLVEYPNGTALTPIVNGNVSAIFSNSSGTFTLPLIFNANDTAWHMFFTAPDPGLRFGLTIPFSFTAGDAFGNTGSRADAFELDVSVGREALVLASIIGAVPPMVEPGDGGPTRGLAKLCHPSVCPVSRILPFLHTAAWSRLPDEQVSILIFFLSMFGGVPLL
jgi:hypothetical protein